MDPKKLMALFLVLTMVIPTLAVCVTPVPYEYETTNTTNVQTLTSSAFGDDADLIDSTTTYMLKTANSQYTVYVPSALDFYDPSQVATSFPIYSDGNLDITAPENAEHYSTPFTAVTLDVPAGYIYAKSVYNTTDLENSIYMLFYAVTKYANDLTVHFMVYKITASPVTHNAQDVFAVLDHKAVSAEYTLTQSRYGYNPETANVSINQFALIDGYGSADADGDIYPMITFAIDTPEMIPSFLSANVFAAVYSGHGYNIQSFVIASQSSGSQYFHRDAYLFVNDGSSNITVAALVTSLDNGHYDTRYVKYTYLRYDADAVGVTNYGTMRTGYPLIVFSGDASLQEMNTGIERSNSYLSNNKGVLTVPSQAYITFTGPSSALKGVIFTSNYAYDKYSPTSSSADAVEITETTETTSLVGSGLITSSGYAVLLTESTFDIGSIPAFYNLVNAMTVRTGGSEYTFASDAIGNLSGMIVSSGQSINNLVLDATDDYIEFARYIEDHPTAIITTQITSTTAGSPTWSAGDLVLTWIEGSSWTQAQSGQNPTPHLNIEKNASKHTLSLSNLPADITVKYVSGQYISSTDSYSIDDNKDALIILQSSSFYDADASYNQGKLHVWTVNSAGIPSEVDLGIEFVYSLVSGYDRVWNGSDYDRVSVRTPTEYMWIKIPANLINSDLTVWATGTPKTIAQKWTNTGASLIYSEHGTWQEVYHSPFVDDASFIPVVKIPNVIDTAQYVPTVETVYSQTATSAISLICPWAGDAVNKNYFVFNNINWYNEPMYYETFNDWNIPSDITSPYKIKYFDGNRCQISCALGAVTSWDYKEDDIRYIHLFNSPAELRDAKIEFSAYGSTIANGDRISLARFTSSAVVTGLDIHIMAYGGIVGGLETELTQDLSVSDCKVSGSIAVSGGYGATAAGLIAKVTSTVDVAVKDTYSTVNINNGGTGLRNSSAGLIAEVGVSGAGPSLHSPTVTLTNCYYYPTSPEDIIISGTTITFVRGLNGVGAASSNYTGGLIATVQNGTLNLTVSSTGSQTNVYAYDDSITYYGNVSSYGRSATTSEMAKATFWNGLGYNLDMPVKLVLNGTVPSLPASMTTASYTATFTAAHQATYTEMEISVPITVVTGRETNVVAEKSNATFFLPKVSATPLTTEGGAILYASSFTADDGRTYNVTHAYVGHYNNAYYPMVSLINKGTSATPAWSLGAVIDRSAGYYASALQLYDAINDTYNDAEVAFADFINNGDYITFTVTGTDSITRTFTASYDGLTVQYNTANGQKVDVISTSIDTVKVKIDNTNGYLNIGTFNMGIKALNSVSFVFSRAGGENGFVGKVLVDEIIGYLNNSHISLTANESYRYGDIVVLDFKNIPVRPNYAFLGWSTSKNAISPEYTENGLNWFYMPAEGSVDLYPVWIYTLPATDIYEHDNSVTTESTYSYTVNSGSNIIWQYAAERYNAGSTLTVSPSSIFGRGQIEAEPQSDGSVTFIITGDLSDVPYGVSQSVSVYAGPERIITWTVTRPTSASVENIPIDAENISLIGSGEVIDINGTEYYFAADAGYVLTEDITLDGPIDICPIDNPFSGTFDGNDHTITLSYETTGSTALFGCIDGASVYDLKIAGDITVTSATQYDYVGLLASIIRDAAIDHIELSGSISASSANVGAMAGYAIDTEVTSSWSTAEIIGETISGGIFAVTDDVELSSVIVAADITGQTAGGLIGQSASMIVLDEVSATGTITGEYTGGLVGVTTGHLIITNSYYAGSSLGTVKNGGIVGLGLVAEMTDVYFASSSADIYGGIALSNEELAMQTITGFSKASSGYTAEPYSGLTTSFQNGTTVRYAFPILTTMAASASTFAVPTYGHIDVTTSAGTIRIALNGGRTGVVPTVVDDIADLSVLSKSGFTLMALTAEGVRIDREDMTSQMYDLSDITAGSTLTAYWLTDDTVSMMYYGRTTTDDVLGSRVVPADAIEVSDEYEYNLIGTGTEYNGRTFTANASYVLTADIVLTSAREWDTAMYYDIYGNSHTISLTGNGTLFDTEGSIYDLIASMTSDGSAVMMNFASASYIENSSFDAHLLSDVTDVTFVGCRADDTEDVRIRITIDAEEPPTKVKNALLRSSMASSADIEIGTVTDDTVIYVPLASLGDYQSAYPMLTSLLSAPSGVTVYKDSNNNEYYVSNNVLYIEKGTSGTGVMQNFTSSRGVKFLVGNQTYTSVVIESGMTSIGNYAFRNTSTITNVNMPNTITSIGNSAFSVCSNLVLTSLPNTITSIGNSAFNNCSNIALTSLPNTLTSIGTNAFFGCASITLTSIPSGVTSIAEYVFYGCTSLTSMTIPSSVTSIGESAFESCTNLALLSLPDSVTSIARDAFRSCTKLTSVTMESSVPCTIGTSAFPSATTIYVPYGSGNAYKSSWSAYASQIVELDPPYTIYTDSNNNEYYVYNGVLTISKGTSGTGIMQNFTSSSKVKALVNNQNYTSVVIESGITRIGDYAFRGDTAITSITLPNTLTAINQFALEGCSNLILNALPNSITTIGPAAFGACSKLALSSLPSSLTTIGSLAFTNCTSLTISTIPSGVTSITNGAFNGCTGITSMTIPSNITSFANNAFYNCTNLTTVTMQSTTPATIGQTVFPNTTTIYVPTSAYDAYVSSWSAYASQIYNPYADVTTDLINVTISPAVNRTLLGQSFVFTLTAAEYAVMQSVTVMMGSVVITPTVVGTQYTISEVTDDISITATANIPTYSLTDDITNGTITYTSGVQTSRLPIGYTEVEYIGLDGTNNSIYKRCHIDTGVTFEDVYKVGVVLSFGDDLANSNLFMTGRSGTDTPNGYIGVRKPLLGNAEYTANNAVVTKTIAFNNNIYSEFLLNSTSVYNICLSGWSDTVWTSQTSYYSVKFWDSDNALTRDFIPCIRTSDDEVGMYDLVSQSFFGNSGTGAFTAGPAVSGKYIQTGTDIVADITPDTYYTYPSAVTVTVGSTVLTSGYTYNASTGHLVIDGASITDDVDITASAELPTYYVSPLSIPTGVTVSPSFKDVQFGDTATFTITSDQYRTVSVTNVSGTHGTWSFSGNTLTITNIQSAVTFTLSATTVSGTIVGNITNGSLDEAGTTFYCGQDLDMHISPNASYSYPTSITVLLNGSSIGDYTYDATTGSIAIEGEDIVRSGSTVTLSVAATCVANEYSVIKVMSHLTASAVLPAGYTEVEYIQSTGPQYIDTGVSIGTDGGAEIRASYIGTAQGSKYLYGVGTSNANRYMIAVASSSQKYLADIGGSTSANRIASDISVQSGWHTHRLDGSAYYIDNVKIGEKQITVSGGSLTAYLFDANGRSGTSVVNSWMISECRIWDNEGTVRDFIPCIRTSDDAVGMYDLVSGQFFGNSGTGTFTAGPEVASNTDYAEYEQPYSMRFTPSVGYDLPASVSVYVGGSMIGTYSYDAENGILRIPSGIINGTVNILASGVAQTYSYSINTVNGSVDSPTGTVTHGQPLTTTFTPSTHYKNPTSITVKVNAIDIPSTSYTYNAATGVLTIPSSVITGNIIVIYTAERITHELITNIDNASTSPVSHTMFNEGDALTVTITADTHYSIPTSVTVYIGGSEYTGFTYSSGAVTIPATATTGNITVTGSAVADQFTITDSITNGTIEYTSGATGRLPTGYTEVEYVHFDKTAYILTDYVPNNDTKTIMDLKVQSGSLYICGAYSTSNSQSYYIYNSQTRWQVATFNTYANVHSPLTYDIKTHIELYADNGKSVLYIENDGTYYNNNAITTSSSNTKPMVFGHGWYNDGISNASGLLGDIYYASCVEGNVVKVELIPCIRNSDNKAGMYETVSGQFLSNGNTLGTITAGNPVTNKAQYGTDLEATINPDVNYKLPSSISVTIGSASATLGTDYTYDDETGEVVINGTSIIGNITISATCVPSITKYYDSNNNEYYVDNGVLYIGKGESGTGVMQNFSTTSKIKELVEEQTYTSVVIESGITAIGKYAFYEDSAITSVVMPDTITSIDNYAFMDCTNLALTSLPSGVTSINSGVFMDCTNLALTSLPSGVTSIGDHAFYNCTNLALTSLPSGVTSIDNNAFNGCTSLALTSLPSGVTSIGNTSFAFCVNLALTSLPSGITSIGHYAFDGCTSMTEVTMENLVPCTIGTGSFPSTTTIWVDISALSSYRTAWSSYASQIGSEYDYSVSATGASVSSASGTADTFSDLTITVTPYQYYVYDAITVTGASDYTYQYNVLTVEGSDVTDDVTISIVYVLGTTTATVSTSHVYSDKTEGESDTATESITFLTAYTVTFTAVAGYNLPDDVEVTINGVQFTGYTYTSGVLTIPAASVTGAISISASASPIMVSVSVNVVNGTQYSGTTSMLTGWTYTLTVNQYYALPTTITLTVGGSSVPYQYNSTTGLIQIDGQYVTDDIIVTGYASRMTVSYALTVVNGSGSATGTNDMGAALSLSGISADMYYSNPTVSVIINGSSVPYTFTNRTLTVAGQYMTADATLTVTFSVTQYTWTLNIDNGTADTYSGTVTHFDDLEVSFYSDNPQYVLPENITVTMGGSSFTAGSYVSVYNSNDYGIYSIGEDVITGNIVIDVDCVEADITLTLQSTRGVPSAIYGIDDLHLIATGVYNGSLEYGTAMSFSVAMSSGFHIGDSAFLDQCVVAANITVRGYEAMSDMVTTVYTGSVLFGSESTDDLYYDPETDTFVISGTEIIRPIEVRVMIVSSYDPLTVTINSNDNFLAWTEMKLNGNVFSIPSGSSSVTLQTEKYQALTLEWKHYQTATISTPSVKSGSIWRSPTFTDQVWTSATAGTPATLTVSASDVTDNITIDVYERTIPASTLFINEVTGMNIATLPTPITSLTTVTLPVTAVPGYTLPDTLTMSINGVLFTDYTYDKQNIVIPASKIYGPITVTGTSGLVTYSLDVEGTGIVAQSSTFNVEDTLTSVTFYSQQYWTIVDADIYPDSASYHPTLTIAADGRSATVTWDRVLTANVYIEGITERDQMTVTGSITHGSFVTTLPASYDKGQQFTVEFDTDYDLPTDAWVAPYDVTVKIGQRALVRDVDYTYSRDAMTITVNNGVTNVNDNSLTMTVTPIKATLELAVMTYTNGTAYGETVILQTEWMSAYRYVHPAMLSFYTLDHVTVERDTDGTKTTWTEVPASQYTLSDMEISLYSTTVNSNIRVGYYFVSAELPLNVTVTDGSYTSSSPTAQYDIELTVTFIPNAHMRIPTAAEAEDNITVRIGNLWYFDWTYDASTGELTVAGADITAGVRINAKMLPITHTVSYVVPDHTEQTGETYYKVLTVRETALAQDIRYNGMAVTWFVNTYYTDADVYDFSSPVLTDIVLYSTYGIRYDITYDWIEYDTYEHHIADANGTEFSDAFFVGEIDMATNHLTLFTADGGSVLQNINVAWGSSYTISVPNIVGKAFNETHSHHYRFAGLIEVVKVGNVFKETGRLYAAGETLTFVALSDRSFRAVFERIGADQPTADLEYSEVQYYDADGEEFDIDDKKYIRAYGQPKYITILMGGVQNATGTYTEGTGIDAHERYNIDRIVASLDANGNTEYPTVNAERMSYFSIDLYDWRAGGFVIQFGTEAFIFKMLSKGVYNVQSVLLTHYEDGVLTDNITVRSAAGSVKFVYDATTAFNPQCLFAATTKTGGAYYPVTENWVALNSISETSFYYIRITPDETCKAQIFQIPTLEVRTEYVKGNYVVARSDSNGSYQDLSDITGQDGYGILINIGYLGNGRERAVYDENSADRYASFAISPYVSIRHDCYLDKWEAVYSPSGSITPQTSEFTLGQNGRLSIVWADYTLHINDLKLHDQYGMYMIDRIDLSPNSAMAYNYLGITATTYSTAKGYNFEPVIDIGTWLVFAFLTELGAMVLCLFLMRRDDEYASPASKFLMFGVMIFTIIVTVVAMTAMI